MRIVVTGIGMINSVGLNKNESFDNIISGKTGVGRITHFDPDGYASQVAGEVKGFDPKTIMNPKDVKKADRFIHFGLAAAKEAMADSGLESYNENRFGVSAASGIGGLPVIEKASVIVETRGPRRISPFFIPSALVNMLGGFVSIEYKLKGPNLANVTACAAGTHAITQAVKTMKAGMADKMMVVAGEACICPVGVGGFSAMKALSTRNDEPEKSSRPFDAQRDGFVMGEGGACLILEKYEDAIERGAKIYAEIMGIGESADANHITTPAPGGEGAYRAMKMAYEMAGEPKVDYINAHGTSTKYNDLYETMAIKALFGGKEKCPPVSSTKGATGHCLGAAGTIEAVITLMAMEKNILPPTVNYEEPDPECDLDYVPNVAREGEINVAMSNSFGFGGTNGVVIFKKV
ncbi:MULTISPECIES: beta-ketoacyl-ACP synthase II [unclassified Lebetimonas]|uniref:beta-ketoacyl-ACP synthase II n=1 Tax=unclassified Lebetimonas TaxID=2648158 RepID=UPI000465E1A6|nr:MULTISPECIES: beta-ketoacyl-ACP synthase II [unclassified Lebetimonas]